MFSIDCWLLQHLNMAFNIKRKLSSRTLRFFFPIGDFKSLIQCQPTLGLVYLTIAQVAICLNPSRLKLLHCYPSGCTFVFIHIIIKLIISQHCYYYYYITIIVVISFWERTCYSVTDFAHFIFVGHNLKFSHCRHIYKRSNNTSYRISHTLKNRG